MSSNSATHANTPNNVQFSTEEELEIMTGAQPAAEASDDELSDFPEEPRDYHEANNQGFTMPRQRPGPLQSWWSSSSSSSSSASPLPEADNKRLALVSGLPPTMTLAELQGRVRSGGIERWELTAVGPISRTKTARILFVDGAAALAFKAGAAHPTVLGGLNVIIELVEE